MSIPQSRAYQTLINDIAAIYERMRRTLVEAYWRIGRRIVEAEQHGELRARYGKGLIKQISADLSEQYGKGFSVGNVYHMRDFYVSHKKLQAPVELEWTQFVALLPVENETQRTQLERQAAREDIPSRELKRMVRAADCGTATNVAPDAKPKKLIAERGILGTFGRVAHEKATAPKGFVLVDLGFNAWHMVTTAVAKALHLTDRPSYTYQARVEKVIDGDTLRVQISCGFGFTIREKLRLRGINAPEIDTPEGKRARAFVCRRLPVGSTIALRTHETDKYDRYVADVWYGSGSASRVMRTAQNARHGTHDATHIAATGTYLNQELLDAGHAVLWK